MTVYGLSFQPEVSSLYDVSWFPWLSALPIRFDSPAPLAVGLLRAAAASFALSFAELASIYFCVYWLIMQILLSY